MVALYVMWICCTDVYANPELYRYRTDNTLNKLIEYAVQSAIKDSDITDWSGISDEMQEDSIIEDSVRLYGDKYFFRCEQILNVDKFFINTDYIPGSIDEWDILTQRSDILQYSQWSNKFDTGLSWIPIMEFMAERKIYERPKRKTANTFCIIDAKCNLDNDYLSIWVGLYSYLIWHNMPLIRHEYGRSVDWRLDSVSDMWIKGYKPHTINKKDDLYELTENTLIRLLDFSKKENIINCDSLISINFAYVPVNNFNNGCSFYINVPSINLYRELLQSIRERTGINAMIYPSGTTLSEKIWVTPDEYDELINKGLKVVYTHFQMYNNRITITCTLKCASKSQTQGATEYISLAVTRCVYEFDKEKHDWVLATEYTGR